MAIKPMKPEQIQVLKAMLWNGALPSNIARTFRPKVSLPAVYHIRSGRRWAEVQWPDGSTGAMPESRREKIDSARRDALAEVVVS